MDDPGLPDRSDEGELQLLSREELESRVRDRTSSLRNVMDTMVDVLLKLGPEGRVEEVNAAVGEVLGYDEETVVGKPVDFLFADEGDGDGPLSAATTEAEFVERLLMEGQFKDVEVYFRSADGETIPMSLSASVMEDDGGGFSGIVCVAKDISERKRAEERAEFLHSLLRHDLGNQLQITMGYLDLLEDRFPEEAGPTLDNVRRGVDSAVELVENVRTLRRLEQDRDRHPVDLAETVEECAGRYLDLARQEGIELTVDVEGAPDVLAGGLLPELFANLIENAIVHSGGDRVRVRLLDGGGGDRAGNDGGPGGDGTGGDRAGNDGGPGSDGADGRHRRVTVVVEDDGRGVPEDRREEILERGEKGPDSDGSGLGMYLAARIADRYGEGIDVRESAWGGARFDVTLEVAPESEGTGARR